MKITYHKWFATMAKWSHFQICVAIFASVFLTVPGAWADVFEVQGVPVDVTADNAAQARSQALARGQDEAFRRLLERLTLKQDAEKLPEPGSVVVTEFVSDFAVSNEKTSTVRYLADLSVRFKAAPVRSLLRRLGIQFAETTSKPILILPVFEDRVGVLLWEDANIWRKAWSLRRSESGLVRIALPSADLADISALHVQHAVSGNLDRLMGLALRHKAGDTVVSYARIGEDLQSGGRRLEISNTRYSSRQEPVTDLLALPLTSIENLEVVMLRAVDAVVAKFEEDWKYENLLDHDGEWVTAVIVPIASLRDWLGVNKLLGSVSVVRRIEIVLISLDEVRINLHHVGAPEQLQTALGQADLAMVNEDDEWVLYPAGLVPLGKP